MATLPTNAIRPVLERLAPQSGPTTDGEALARFVRDRDEAAFAHLVRRFGPLVMGVCRRVLGNRPESDDVFQATFWVLVRRAGSIRQPRTLPAWLHAVALRTARRALRRIGPVANPAAEPLAMDDPFADASWREVRQRLDEEVRRLPAKLRLPILLCYFEELTRDEAADRLGWSLSTLKRRLETARERLRLRLLRRGIGPGLLGAATLLSDRLTARVPATLESTATGLAHQAPPAAVRSLAATAPGLKMWLVTAVAIAGLGWGIALMGGPGAPPAPKEPPAKDPPTKEPPTAEKPKEAAVAETLPPGAVARIGTTRYRASMKFWFGSYSKDGRWFVSGTDGVELWDLDTGLSRQLAPVRNNTLPRPRISQDGSLIAVLDGGPGIHLFDRATGKELRTVGDKENFGEFQISPDGKRVVGITAGVAKGFDVRTGVEVFSTGAAGSVLDDWNDRSVFFVVGGNKDGALAVRVVDAETGKDLKTFETGITDYYKPKEPDPSQQFRTGISIPDVMRYAVAQDLSHLAYQRADGTVAVVALTPGAKPRPIELIGGLRPTGLKFAPDGKSLFAFDLWGTLTRSDVANGKLLGQFSGGLWHVDPASRVLTSAGQDGLIRRWDLTTNKQIPLAAGGFGSSVRVAITADGSRVIAGARGGAIEVWSAEGKPLYSVPGADGSWTTFAVSPDGRTLVVTRAEAMILWWDLVAGKELAKTRIPGTVPDQDYRSVGEMAFTPDGRRLVCSKHDATLFVIETETRKELWRIGPPTDKDYDAAVGLGVSVDGRYVARGLRRGGRTGDWGYGLQIVDVATGKPVKITDVSEKRGKEGLPDLKDLRYTPDGRFLMLVSLNGRVQVRWADTLAEFSSWMTGSRYSIALGVSPDGRTVLTGDDDGTTRLWETLTGKLVASVKGHRSTVYSVAASPDGRRLATGGIDKVAYVWDVKPKATTPENSIERIVGDDAAAAREAIWAIAADPDGPKKLRQRFKPVEDPKPEIIRGWIADLDDTTFARREAASKALSEAGVLVEPAIRKALADKPTAEARERLEKVLSSFDRKPTRNDVLHSRAVHAMELANTEAAREVLKEWAGGVAGAWLTVDAKLALDRLRRR